MRSMRYGFAWLLVYGAMIAGPASQAVRVAPVWTPFEADFERVDNHSGSVETRGRIYVDRA